MHVRWSVLVAAITIACSSGTGNSSATGQIGDLCSSGAVQCGPGMYCAEGGDLQGRCTADCSMNSAICQSMFGNDTLCYGLSLCARACTNVAQCGGAGECTLLTSGESACLSE